METMEIEVKNIYRDEKPRSNHTLESGSVHVYIPQLKIHIKHIVYFIKEKDEFHIFPPSRWLKAENKKTSVPCIAFDDTSIWEKIFKVVKESVLSVYKENHPETP